MAGVLYCCGFGNLAAWSLLWGNSAPRCKAPSCCRSAAVMRLSVSDCRLVMTPTALDSSLFRSRDASRSSRLTSATTKDVFHERLRAAAAPLDVLLHPQPKKCCSPDILRLPMTASVFCTSTGVKSSRCAPALWC